MPSFSNDDLYRIHYSALVRAAIYSMANVQDRGPPSAAAIAIGSSIVAIVTGYFLGRASSIGVFGRSPSVSGEDDDDEDADISDAESETPTEDLGELKAFPGSTEECKLVLAVRTDLGMTKGG
jgi:PTH2 family peptidyl-tRNA hydrolase